MPTSNFKLFNENKANMLTDTEYSSNAQRLNGVQSGIASSKLQNKFQYQSSLVAYAIAQLMVQNGYDATDSTAVTTFINNMSNTMLQKVVDKATDAQAKEGTNTTKWMTPALVKSAITELAPMVSAILSNETKTLYGLDDTATPDDVFKKINSDAKGKPGDIKLSGIDISDENWLKCNGLLYGEDNELFKNAKFQDFVLNAQEMNVGLFDTSTISMYAYGDKYYICNENTISITKDLFNTLDVVTLETTPSAYNNVWWYLLHVGNLFIATKFYKSTSSAWTNLVYTSIDAKTWELKHTETGSNPFRIYAVPGYIVYLNGKYYIIDGGTYSRGNSTYGSARSATVMRITTDFSTFDEINIPIVGSYDLNNASYMCTDGNNIFISVTEGDGEGIWKIYLYSLNENNVFTNIPFTQPSSRIISNSVKCFYQGGVYSVTAWQSVSSSSRWFNIWYTNDLSTFNITRKNLTYYGNASCITDSAVILLNGVYSFPDMNKIIIKGNFSSSPSIEIPGNGILYYYTNTNEVVQLLKSALPDLNYGYIKIN